MVDAQLDRLLSHNGHADAERAREELWAASVRKYNGDRRRERVAAWIQFHKDQAERIERTARELAAEHRHRAEQLMTDGREESS